jgi:hypothetical protein
MKNGQSQPFPTLPPRPFAHPTAPRPDTNTPPPGFLPRHHRSYEHFQNMPQTVFPGMSRTASARKPAGFAPGTPGDDEPMTQRTSAYAHVHGQRYDSYFPDDGIPRSPTMARPEPATSPLKKSHSSTNLNDASRRPRRPEVERISTQYATSGGEKTYVNGVGRSASLRNSPVEREWGSYGDDDLRRPHSHHASSARHQSASPNLRPTHPTKELSSSESDSSSDAEPENFACRPKVKPRPRRQKAGTGGFAFRHVVADDPTMNSQFPPPNHKHAHSPQDEYAMQYKYPPPPPRSDPRIFPEPQPFQSGGNSRTDDIREHVRHISAEDPRIHPNMYATFHSPSPNLVSRLGFLPLPKLEKQALHSMVFRLGPYPRACFLSRNRLPQKECLETFIEQNVGKMQDLFSHATPLFNEELFSKADHVSCTSYSGAHEPGNRPYPQPGYQNVSQEHINTTFSAADWDGKFNSGDEHFRPTTAREGKSPSRTARTRARSVGRGRMSPNKGDHSSEPIDLTSDSDGREAFEAQDQNGRDRASMPTAQAAFPPGKFSAEEWAAKLKDQTWAMPSSELNSNNPKTLKRPSKSGGVRRPIIPTKDDTDAAHNGQPRVASKFVSETAIPSQSHSDATINGGRRASSGDVADAMDIDDSISDTVPLAPHTSNTLHNRDQPAPPCEYPTTADVNLNNLANVAPFAPSSTGLKDMDDLSTNLPFKSRAAPDVHHSKTVPGSSSDLRLPKPPKQINPPAHIDEVSWKGYVADMNAYFYDWSVFNKKMIEHFRSRQEQVDMSMASHWISMVGDGPPPEALDGSKAGYATFMAWLEEDTKVRQWWDVANERNKQCFEDLGKTRARVKAASGPAPF